MSGSTFALANALGLTEKKINNFKNLSFHQIHDNFKQITIT